MVQEPTAELLQHWHEFYLLVGTAAAALVALLFVAASIGAGILTKHPGGPTRTYMSPRLDPCAGISRRHRGAAADRQYPNAWDLMLSLARRRGEAEIGSSENR